MRILFFSQIDYITLPSKWLLLSQVVVGVPESEMFISPVGGKTSLHLIRFCGWGQQWNWQTDWQDQNIQIHLLFLHVWESSEEKMKIQNFIRPENLYAILHKEQYCEDEGQNKRGLVNSSKLYDGDY